MKSINSAFLALILLAYLPSLATAQATIQSTPISPTYVRPEKTLSKTVVRITGKVQGVDQPFNATGFIVVLEDSRLHNSNGFTFLVTNRHVAQAINSDAAGNPLSHTVLQMKATFNLKTPAADGKKTLQVPLPPEGIYNWIFPDDSSIDLAVIPIKLEENYDVAEIPTASFFTQDVWDKYLIAPGDKVLTCGYFLHYAGTHEFQPIIREGSLAMVPDDVMPVAIGGSARVYLADLHVIPGNSGSPLFLAPMSTLGGYVSDGKGGIPYGLLGVVSGYMWEDSKLTLHEATERMSEF